MRIIGLLGGMSFEASALYYRLINEAVRARLGGLHSADILMRSVDFDTIATLQTRGDWPAAGALLAEAASGLERAGAACILVCANTMHLVADAVADAVAIPLIHIVDETAHRLRADGRRKPLLLATRYTMEHGFFQDRMARHGIHILVPDEPGRRATHAIIYDELCRGRVLPASRDALTALIERARDEGADSVLFGCTEIGMILDPAAVPLPGYDSTVIHADAAVAFSLG